MQRSQGVEGKMNHQTPGVITYAFRTRRWIFIGLIAVLGSIVITFLILGYKDPRTIWDNFFDWPTAVLTLIVASFVFLSELREEWRESLPKKLTVIFIYQNTEIMSCNSATLSGEADLRALSQQIGRQMAGNRDLELKPMLDDWFKAISPNKREMLYTATIVLRSLPPELQTVYDRKEKLVWNPPFTQEPEAVKVNG